jgi:hypothetical protein
MVKDGVAPFLKTFGFTRRRNSFFRPFPGGFDVVGLQKSSWNDRKSAKFTVNLGVCWLEAQALLGRPVRGIPFSADWASCTVHRRIGRVMPEQRDFWWNVSGTSDLGAVQLDLLERLDRYAIPWLDSAHDLERSIALCKENRFPKHEAALESLRNTNGQPDGAANRSQPVRPETNQTSAAAGSGR